MSDHDFSPEFLSGFYIACGAIAAFNVVIIAPFLIGILFYIPVMLVDLITLPFRRVQQRREDAIAKEAFEKDAKRHGFVSAEAFEKYLDILKHNPGYVSPSKVMTHHEYVRPWGSIGPQDRLS